MEVSSFKHLKDLSHFLRNCPNDKLLLDNFIYGVSKIFKADLSFVDIKGNVIKEINEHLTSLGTKNSLTNEIKVDAQLIGQLFSINENKVNVRLDNFSINFISKDILQDFYAILLPIFISNEKLGVLIIYKNSEFNLDLDIILEYISSVLGILLSNTRNVKNAEIERNVSIVKSSMATLSYSELEAVINIFDELDGEEGVLIASKIADKANLTRSVIVNALRKFESSEIIETRSLGVKGTYIKVLNKYLLEEINKFKK